MLVKEHIAQIHGFAPAGNVPKFLACFRARTIGMGHTEKLDASPTRYAMHEDVPEGIEDVAIVL